MRMIQDEEGFAEAFEASLEEVIADKADGAVEDLVA